MINLVNHTPNSFTIPILTAEHITPNLSHWCSLTFKGVVSDNFLGIVLIRCGKLAGWDFTFGAASTDLKEKTRMKIHPKMRMIADHYMRNWFTWPSDQP